MHRLLISLCSILALIPFSASSKDPKFSLVPNFFEENPGGKSLGPCHGGVVTDKAGNIYVTTDTERGIVVFSKGGKYLKSVGPKDIHGLELRNEKGTEYIYGARPMHHEVIKLKLDGEQVWSIGYPKEAGIYTNADQFKPCALTVAPDGSIFIADGYGQNYVLKFDKDRKFVKAFGGQGDKEGTFKTCHGIAIDTRGKKPLLFVCNRNIGRVEHWDLDGNFVRTLQKDLRMPAAVMIQGDYAVVPELQGRVTVLDKEGNIVAQLGDNPDPKKRANNPLPPDQWTPEYFNSPHGACFDKKGDILVTEWSKYGRVSKWSRK